MLDVIATSVATVGLSIQTLTLMEVVLSIFAIYASSSIFFLIKTSLNEISLQVSLAIMNLATRKKFEMHLRSVQQKAFFSLVLK